MIKTGFMGEHIMQQTNVLEYLERTVQRVPDKVAYANEDMGLTFSQVSHDSKAIGSYLQHRGYYHEPVIVFMQKHPKTIAAFYGCVYGGNYYVPIDDEMPAFRIQLIFQKLKARIMICDHTTIALAEKFGFAGETIRYDEIAQYEINEAALARIRDAQLDTDPIYIVFTSGSTGIPKGVVACHRSVIDYIENLSEVLGFHEDTRFANQTPLYFDACLKELYPTLKFGATTYLVPKQLFMFPVKLVEFLNKYEINTICWVVSALTMISALHTFDKVIPKYLHTVAFGSEVFPIRQFRVWKEALPEAQFINLYGPTETTGMCCYYKVDRDFALDEVMPVGRPFHNTEILLLNDKNAAAASGETGEICVRGTSLTLGYYRAFEQTNESFVQNPLNTSYPELIYRTGDLGRWNERGELVFISRKDHQIKHMGHRIELGEIEVNVNLLDGVRAACCIYDQERGKIALYYTGEIDKRALVTKLKERLPRYMIPNVVEHIDHMPLTANGKLDRAFLKDHYQEQKGSK